VDNVAALAELPRLRKVHFSRCGSLDVTPLTTLDHLTVTVD